MGMGCAFFSPSIQALRIKKENGFLATELTPPLPQSLEGRVFAEKGANS